MSEKQLEELGAMTENLFSLQRAPSQFKVFYHLVYTGKTLTVGEISSELDLTPKATERAIAKLLEKGLILRSPFRSKSYTCDTKQLLLSLILTVTKIYDDYKKKK